MFKTKNAEKETVAPSVSEAEPEFPSKGTSGSGSGRGYLPQARYVNDGDGLAINDWALGPKWKTIPFEKILPPGVGIPTRTPCHGHIPHSNLLSYEAAQAIRWWFLAFLEAHMVTGSLCVETRLVKHDCQYSFSETAVEAADFTGYGH